MTVVSMSYIRTHQKAGCLAGWRRGWPGCPSWCIHSTVSRFTSSPRGGRYVSTALSKRAAGSCCDRVICVSKEQAAWAKRLGIADGAKIMSIVNAVQVPELPSPERIRRSRVGLGLDDNTPLVLCVGRLCAAKNYGDMLSAMKFLLRDYPKAQLFIAGDGPLELQLKREAMALGVMGSVKFLGFREDVPDLVAAADVVALSSVYEGMPLAMLEAMAAAKPVVATAIMGVREVIRDGVTGVMVPPRKPEHLAAAIASVLEKPQWAQQIGLNGRRQVMAEHSMQGFLQGYEGVYRELVRSKAAGAGSAWHRGRYMVEYRRR